MVDLDKFTAELQAQKKRLPPVHLWHPEDVGSIDIRIDREGRWYHEGEVIRRAAMVKVFSSVLRREGDDYFLVTPQDKLAIEVEDVPFVAVEMEHSDNEGEPKVLFISNVGEHVIADSEHPIWIADGRPYVVVRDSLNALITRSVYYRLVELAEIKDNHAYLRSCGQRFDLGSVE